MYELEPQIPHYPSDYELANLFTGARQWLEANRPLQVNGNDQPAELQLYDGLPVFDDYPSHSLNVSGEVLKRIVPNSAERLRIENADTLEILYYAPGYIRNSKGYEYTAPALTLYYAKEQEQDDGFQGLHFELGHDKDAGWNFRTDRRYRSSPPEGLSLNDILLAAIHNGAQVPKGDYDDYVAVRDVIDNLQALKQAMEEEGLHMVLDSAMHDTERRVRHEMLIKALTVGRLDEGRSALLAPRPADAIAYSRISKNEVELMYSGLSMMLLETEKPEVRIGAEALQAISAPFSEATIRGYLHGTGAAYELTVTHPPRPEMLINDIARMDEIITFYKGSYVREIKAYDMDGNCTEHYDVTAETPLEHSDHMFVVMLARNRKSIREQ